MVVMSELKAIVYLFKDIRQGIKALQNYNPELIDKLGSLHEMLLEFRSREIDLINEIDALKQQVSNRELPYDQGWGAYYTEENGVRSYYCQRCLDTDSKRCRLQSHSDYLHCTVCNTNFSSENRRKSPPTPAYMIDKFNPYDS